MKGSWKLGLIVFVLTISIGLIIDNFAQGLNEDQTYNMLMIVNAIVVTIAVIVYFQIKEKN